jgi:hypothetical protein
MTEIKEEPTYHYCKHDKMIWSDDNENDNREPCVLCTLDYYRQKLSALEQWQKEAVPFLRTSASNRRAGYRDLLLTLIKQAEEK